MSLVLETFIFVEVRHIMFQLGSEPIRFGNSKIQI